MKPKLLIESHVPHVPDELGEYFDIQRLAPEKFTHDAVADADAMIIRTRTRCNASLLSQSKVRFIATATIGTDHIDLPWCAERGITVASAPGCNAPAVAQYVMASLLTLFPDGLKGLKIGVIGVGHVGSIVADWAEQLGMTVMQCDPPRAEREPDFISLPFEEILPQVDIVTFHVPHTTSGAHPTHHIANASLFNLMRDGAVIINSARGPIVNTPDLIAAIESGKVAHAVIDCWEGEPNISPRLLQLATIATPHIAGYSLNGKIRATSMAVNALCATFGLDYRMTPAISSSAARHVTGAAIAATYNPLVDTINLRQPTTVTNINSAQFSGHFDPKQFARHFETLRNTYPLRPEVPEAE